MQQSEAALPQNAKGDIFSVLRTAVTHLIDAREELADLAPKIIRHDGLAPTMLDHVSEAAQELDHALREVTIHIDEEEAGKLGKLDEDTRQYQPVSAREDVRRALGILVKQEDGRTDLVGWTSRTLRELIDAKEALPS